MPVLTIDDFSLELKNDTEWRPILHNISLSLEKGRTLGIVGESGSGKSVTALSVMRLIDRKISRITSGSITFHDEKDNHDIELTKLTEQELQHIRGNRIAMIFQEPMTSLNPVIKCGEQITEALLLHTKMTKKQAQEEVISLFKEVMLPRPEKIFDSYPHELSGGQKQRVMIAMAMSCRPDILIADEPTTALDVTVQKGILELIKKLQQKHGMSVIFITHDLGVVAEIADEIIVLYKGNIVERGEVKPIFTNPQHPYTKGLLACRPPLNVRLKVLPTVDDFMHSYEQGQNRDIQSTLSDLTVSPEERKHFHIQLYKQEPLIVWSILREVILKV